MWCETQDLLHVTTCIWGQAEAIPRRSRRGIRDRTARAIGRRERNHVEVGVEPLRSKYAEANQPSCVRRAIRIEARIDGIAVHVDCNGAGIGRRQRRGLSQNRCYVWI